MDELFHEIDEYLKDACGIEIQPFKTRRPDV